jgi:LacI family transcriptional regulator
MEDLTRKQVAIIANKTLAFGRGVLLGISRYARETARNWVPVVWDSPTQPPPWDQTFDGAVGYITYDPVVKWVEQHAHSVVSTSGQRRHLPIPRVLNDDVAIGSAAAKHLLEAGHERFLFVGHRGRQHSRNRFAGFQRALHNDGAKATRSYLDHQPTARQVLTHLATPLAVFCNNDRIAVDVLTLCRKLELQVPEQVAILGVDDDELVCETAPVPISSVRIDARRVGYEAAALLHRMMDGQDPPTTPILIPPLGVTARQSTQHYAVSDPVVAQALEWIEHHCRSRINVPDLAEAVGLSRSALERRFAQAMDLTPYQAILRAHVERAADLLANTDWSMERVARASGFSSGKMLSTTFARHMGCCPSEYRTRHRTSEASSGAS